MSVKHFKLLSKIAKKSKAQRVKHIAALADDPSVCSCLRIACKNLRANKVQLGAGHIRKLKPHKALISSLARKGNSKARKRKLVKQSGGALLPLLLPVFANLLISLIKRKRE